MQWPGAARGDEWAFPYPDVRLSIGPREFVHFFVGVGNSQPSSMAVGWPYGGLGWAPSRALRLEGRFALETVHATVQLRGDLTTFVRVSPHVSLRFGAGVGQSVDSTLSVPFSGEGNLGVVLIP